MLDDWCSHNVVSKRRLGYLESDFLRKTVWEWVWGSSYARISFMWNGLSGVGLPWGEALGRIIILESIKVPKLCLLPLQIFLPSNSVSFESWYDGLEVYVWYLVSGINCMTWLEKSLGWIQFLTGPSLNKEEQKEVNMPCPSIVLGSIQTRSHLILSKSHMKVVGLSPSPKLLPVYLLDNRRSEMSFVQGEPKENH